MDQRHTCDASRNFLIRIKWTWEYVQSIEAAQYLRDAIFAKTGHRADTPRNLIFSDCSNICLQNLNLIPDQLMQSTTSLHAYKCIDAFHH